MSREWFAQQPYRVRLEWGWRGARVAAERGDVLVVVDTLVFSSTAVTAVSQGVILYPSAKDEAAEIAARVGAEVAVHRQDVSEKARYSLSPLTFRDAPAGIRVVLPSPNGATCTRYGRDVPRLYVGTLLNAAAVAESVTRALQETDAAVTVLACGERWQEPSEDGELRFALEDYLGAGAILAFISPKFTHSPEARAAQAVFWEMAEDLESVLLGCSSGIELAARGYEGDVRHAARLNKIDTVPLLCEGERLEPAD